MNTIEIFNNYYTTIDKIIGEFLETKNKDKLFQADFRGKLFAVEGILRMHLKSPENDLSKDENKLLEKILIETKEVEDFLGAYSLLFELGEYAELKMPKDMKDKFKKEITQEQNKKHAELLLCLDKYKTLAKKHNTLLKDINWPKKEKKFLKRTLSAELKRLNKKVSKDLKDLILAEKYGYEELEEGFHEFRRAIRWVSIYIQGYKPFFALGKLPKKIKSKDLKVVEEYKNSPFAQLSVGDNLIEIDALKYYKLSYHIGFIGKIKTQGEMNYYLLQRGYDLGESVQIEPLAHAAYNGFIDDDVFEDFIL